MAVQQFHPEAKGPLDGLVVLDLSRLVAGNMVSLQLADFEAEVIKIEDPGSGDPLRAWKVEGISVHWKVYGRNKKSVTLNLRDAEGMASSTSWIPRWATVRSRSAVVPSTGTPQAAPSCAGGWSSR